jgi:Anti-repressor SinI
MTAELPKNKYFRRTQVTMLPTLLDEKEVDKEWLELILEARNLGITVDEIKDFLKDPSNT